MPDKTPVYPSRRGWDRRIILILLGVALGYLLRFLMGPPAEEYEALDRRFRRPLPVVMPEIDLPIDRQNLESSP